jgi:hypothetical protein
MGKLPHANRKNAPVMQGNLTYLKINLACGSLIALKSGLRTI